MKRATFTGDVGYTIDDTRYAYQYTDKTPKAAPNVVYIVLDDLGFAQLGCYGSSISTPNIDRLAGEGLRYNNFHTTAICSATRASLLTGMNHHTAGICAVVEHMTGCDNGIGHLHRDCATLAEILHEYDYSSYAVGKWHLTDVSETTEAGPFDNWPLGKGFDKYYGFLHAQMDQFHPRLFQDNQPVEQPKSVEEGYHFSEDIVDKAINYVYHQKAVYPEKPFFLYVAFGAMHTPHHAPKEYIDRYKGKFDEGWDVLRQQWFERQKTLGIIPEDARLTPRNEFVKPWDELTEKQKKTAARYMEAFAGMLTHTDEQIGRLLDFLRDRGELDNTIVVLISDNGASAEGGTEGTFNNFRKLSASRGDAGKVDPDLEADYVLERLDEIGGPNAFNHYPIGWANLGNTPFPWYKIWTYSGGVKDPMIVRYPKLVKDPGAIRTQYHHVSDITPTVLDIIGVQKPEHIKGVHQRPFQGTSFKYTLEQGDAGDQKHVQYYEMLGNRAIYKDGWKAIVNHSRNASGGEFADDVWELYHVAEDYSESENVAEQYPDKVQELERAWLIEAAKAGVFPMFDGTMYGSKESAAKMYTSMRRRERFDTYENLIGPVDLIRALQSDLTSHSHVFRAEIERTSIEEKGTIFSSGNRFGGHSLYILQNRLKFTYNYGAEQFFTITSGELRDGTLHVEYRQKIREDGSAHIELYLEGERVGEIVVPEINGFVDFVTTIGADKQTPVAYEDYESPFVFEGRIRRAVIYVAGHEATLSEELEVYFKAD